MLRLPGLAFLFAALAWLANPDNARASLSFTEDPLGGPIAIGGFGFSADPDFGSPSAEEAHAVAVFATTLDANDDILGAAAVTINGQPAVLRTLYWTDPATSLISDWLIITATVADGQGNSTIRAEFHSILPTDPQPTLSNVNNSLFNQGSESGPFTSFTNYFEDADDGSFINADVGGISISITSVADEIPEPTSMALLGAGILGCAVTRRRLWRTSHGILASD
jgi:PEP-CTERM motif